MIERDEPLDFAMARFERDFRSGKVRRMSRYAECTREPFEEDADQDDYGEESFP